MENSKASRLHYIDFIRGIAVILMIIGHSKPPTALFKGIFGFHMPIFFFISGYIFNFDKWKELGLKRFLADKWKDLMVPFYVLCTINLVINCFRRIIVHHNTLGELVPTYVQGIIIANGSKLPNCLPLWFLPCMFIGMLLLYLILKISSNAVRFGAAFFMVVIGTIISIADITRLPFHTDTALFSVLFLLLGYSFRNYDAVDNLHKPDFVIILSITVIIGFYCIYTNSTLNLNGLIVGNAVLSYVGATAISAALVTICKRLDAHCSLVEFWGRNTVYFMGFNGAINKSYTLLPKLPYIRAVYKSWWQLTCLNILVITLIILVKDLVKSAFKGLERSV